METDKLSPEELGTILTRKIFEIRVKRYLNSDKHLIVNDYLNDIIIEFVKKSFIRKKSFKLYYLNYSNKNVIRERYLIDPFKNIDDEKVIKCFKEKDHLCEEFEEFINFYIMAYCKYLCKELFKNNNFIINFYKCYIEDYLITTFKSIKNNVVSHIKLESIIDPFFTGMINFIKSNDYFILYKKYNTKCIQYANRIRKGSKKYCFKDEVFNDWVNQEFSEIIFKKVLMHILFVISLIFIDNNKTFKALNEIVKDCEMGYSRKLSIINNKFEVYIEFNKEISEFATELANNPGSKKSIKTIITKYFDIFAIYANNRNNKDFTLMFKNLMINNEEIDLEFYNKFINKTGFQSKINKDINEANHMLKTYAEYNISEHYRDIVFIDPMYKAFMTIGLSIENNECKKVEKND